MNPEYKLTFVRPSDEYSCTNSNEFLKHYSRTMDAKFSTYTENYTILQIDLQLFEDVFTQFDNEYFEGVAPVMRRVTNIYPSTNRGSRFLFSLNRYTK